LTATLLLIRHAAHGELGAVLSGRRPGLSLSPAGLAQAEALARHLADMPLAAIHCGPLERTSQTARLIARFHPLVEVEPAAALNEVDFGAWNGRSFAELASDPEWDRWNSARTDAATPGGETMVEAQERAWVHCVRTALAHPGETLVMVSHCDVIRALVARVIGVPLDNLLRFEVDPASISRVEIGEWGARLLSLNEGVAR